MKLWIARAAGIVLSSVAISWAASADEGMWTFDAFPAAKVKAAYGFAPDKAWLDRVRTASVRLDVGCSASVVSKDGLILTNHHCVTGCTADLSSVGNDLVANGYLAATRREEKACPGFEASILQSVTDVTAKVKSAIANTPASELAAKRAATIAGIEHGACGDDETRGCEVVSLYRGGQYKLYGYQRYTDVRLAFAPEMQAAFFGGDPDNFNFPRYAFDMALMRLYRNGQPATFKTPLVIDATGADVGELVFVPGHPGGTDRLKTNSQLAFERDHVLPTLIEYYAQLRGSLLTMASRSEEDARQATGALDGVENTLKALKGERSALVAPIFFGAKISEEKALRDALATRAGLREKYGDPFVDMDRAVAAQASTWLPWQMLEARLGSGSVLVANARRLVRAAAERGKPADQRLPEFTPSRLPGLERGVLAIAPVNNLLEQLEIEFWLLKMRENLGADYKAVKAVFGASSASEIARDIVANSRLGDPAFRKRLLENPGEVATSNDPAIALYRRIDSHAREARKTYEAGVTGPAAVASERIAALRFDVMGDQAYPDATFTLRLSYGAVKGWQDPAFGETPAFTYVKGLWERATGAYPFNLVPKWLAAKGKLSPETPMNLVTDNDIIGGNSGSPLLDREGRVVGLVFDGNIHSLGGKYGFDPQLNRTVAVSAPMLLEGLRKVYNANALADELQAK